MAKLNLLNKNALFARFGDPLYDGGAAWAPAVDALPQLSSRQIAQLALAQNADKKLAYEMAQASHGPEFAAEGYAAQQRLFDELLNRKQPAGARKKVRNPK